VGSAWLLETAAADCASASRSAQSMHSGGHRPPLTCARKARTKDGKVKTQWSALFIQHEDKVSLQNPPLGGGSEGLHAAEAHRPRSIHSGTLLCHMPNARKDDIAAQPRDV
jgi:hypothetical protein